MKTLLFIAVLIACALPVRALAAGAGADVPQLERAARLLAQFEKTAEPASFDDALVELQAVDVPARPSAERDRVTNAWFGLFRVLDRIEDPNFDPNDLPELNVIPPSYDGITYPAGVEPSAIADPATRAAYERALRENEAKSARYAAQYPLRDLDTRATDAFHQYRGRSYAATSADAAAFARALAKSGLSAARQTSLRR